MAKKIKKSNETILSKEIKGLKKSVTTNKKGDLSLHLHYIQVLVLINFGMFMASFILEGNLARLVIAGLALLYIYLNYHHHYKNNTLQTQTLLEYSLVAFICWFIYASL